ncbi:hypothetical protein XFF7767_900040 [Xanthomonas citri pv. fuscans]|nr:hypothetical protein XFF7767_900040 [Xanthomonas citri pv. fuscans]SOO16956.1 hypothetical protein XFF7766_970018 [Xanthomonas citri pv. fuscans]
MNAEWQVLPACLRAFSLSKRYAVHTFQATVQVHSEGYAARPRPRPVPDGWVLPGTGQGATSWNAIRIACLGRIRSRLLITF